MNKSIRIVAVLLLVLLLILIRAFAPELFYDPFIEFFQNNFLVIPFPEYDITNLLLSLIFRFLLNSILSLGILFFIFLDKNQLMFAIKFYLVAGICLFLVFLWQLDNEFFNGYLMPFYIRRLLIHPIFLLILTPAFFYQKKVKQ